MSMRANWTLAGTVQLLNSDQIPPHVSVIQDVGARQAQLQFTPLASPAGHTATPHIF